MKPLKEMSFEELTETASREIHSSLLLEGGKGLKGSVHVWLQAAISWADISWADSTQGKDGGKKLTQKKKKVYIVKRPGLTKKYVWYCQICSSEIKHVSKNEPKICPHCKDRGRNKTYVGEDGA